MNNGITQTILASEGDTNQLDRVFGNCMQAAIATYFEKPLDWVPHFAQFVWYDAAIELWARGFGKTVKREATTVIPERRCLVAGRSPRGFLHLVVGEGGRVIWDPHPSREGLSIVTEVWWFEGWHTDGICFICKRSDVKEQS